MNDALLQRVHAAFDACHGAPPAFTVQSPGRVNLIGEHTDYNDGFVLPCAIGFRTLVAVRPRGGARVRVVAADQGDAIDEFAIDAPIPRHESAPWANYVRGVFEVMRQRGRPLVGADLAIAGDVPQGSGLSSSASLEVAVAQAAQTATAGALLTPTQLALVAQQAENEFVGCRCGVMDQLISARGEAGHALLIDCRDLGTRAVPLPAGMAVMIVNSHIPRGLVDSAYNERRAQCEAAARHLGVAALRDASLALLAERGAGLDPVALRRARHVVTENQRTLDAADALAAGDLRQLGVLMAASHASMKDDFEITVPGVDRLAQLLRDAIGELGGARMTGGGFGGCVVALMPAARVAAARAAVARDYRSPAGQPGTVYVCESAAGVGLLAV